MRIQQILAVLVCSFGLVAMNASAGMINHVDFPEEFVKAKEKFATEGEVTEEVKASSKDVQK